MYVITKDGNLFKLLTNLRLPQFKIWRQTYPSATNYKDLSDVGGLLIFTGSIHAILQIPTLTANYNNC